MGTGAARRSRGSLPHPRPGMGRQGSSGRGLNSLGKRFGSFESWFDVMGGVLAVAGIDGLLENREKLADQGNDELDPWKRFIHLWQDAQLKGILLEARTEQLEGRVIGAVRIKSRVLSGGKLYRIENVPGPLTH